MTPEAALLQARAELRALAPAPGTALAWLLTGLDALATGTGATLDQALGLQAGVGERPVGARLRTLDRDGRLFVLAARCTAATRRGQAREIAALLRGDRQALPAPLLEVARTVRLDDLPRSERQLERLLQPAPSPAESVAALLQRPWSGDPGAT